MLVVALVAFGIYLSVGGFRGDGAEEEQQADQVGGEDRNPGEQQSEAVPPSPIPTTAAEDMEVMDWLPFTEEEFTAAAATAQGFAEAYGTMDYSEPPEAYYDRMAAFATEDYAETLAQSSGAGALWGEMAENEAVAEGRANVESIRSFDDDSIIFVVNAQSITEDASGARDDLGEYAITTVEDGEEWRVYDFQPADAANLGGD
ncbi:hypothetical protein HDA32_000762 [Spinactinospora alkalitolerans]|uniref:Uncharacterized protein n=1 Tax=Spinactinospora alkalitolerans TaxID=687207 RepID=A0A852TS12_9ACTN|nr:hypothetical protein [Spinactinospora alkalitolerans]